MKSSGLTAGMLVILMLSPLLLWMPKLHLNVHLDLPWAKSELANVVNVGAVNEDSWGLMSLLMWIYGIGCVVLLLKLWSHFMAASRWCSESVLDQGEQHRVLLEQCAEQLQLSTFPELRFSDQVISPVITGLIHPVLLLPMRANSWSDETIKMVMLHELGHLQRRDLWASLAGQIACALHWFNPLVWILRKRLSHECEYACDAHVISSGANPGNYINALCDVAETCGENTRIKARRRHSFAFSAALSMANQASLRNRVVNLLEKGQGVNQTNSLIVISILAITASAALALNLVSSDAKQDVKQSSLDEPYLEQTVLPDEAEIKLRLTANPFPGE